MINQDQSVSTVQDAHVERAKDLVSRMTLAEKLGQMSQVAPGSHEIWDNIARGMVGSVLNEINPDTVNDYQRVAVEHSRLGIPLMIGRDVIHGFKTILPIPLGQAASWNPELVKKGARIAALEASRNGINWTFAPMIDITREPRWGRIAESLGEDPYLCGEMGAAMVEGFQGDDLSAIGSIAACAKHFAGYGAAEAGLDYNTTNIPENELRNVYLRPFKRALDSGCATMMAAFSDLDGVPASGNEFLLRQVLRHEWDFNGFVVSDWDSLKQLCVHGFSENECEAAFEAANAGVNMEMVSTTYRDNLPALIADSRISEADIDQLVMSIIEVKSRLGLFEQPYTNPDQLPELLNNQHRDIARESARQSCVLLKNDNDALPLQRDKLSSIAVIGPLADDGYEQLGTWVFDGEAEHSVTYLQGIQEQAGNALDIQFRRGLESTRSQNQDEFGEAVELAANSDVAILFMGEEAILSGEAHSRASIDLPGAQAELIREVAATGTPVVLVVLAGRPLCLESVLEHATAVLYAWHPGTMGGPGIADLLFGNESPSGKLPVTFPRAVGQVPIYYARKNTGRPPVRDELVFIDDIDPKAGQTSTGMTAYYLDVDYTPLFPFGFGLSYSRFDYSQIELSAESFAEGETLNIKATLRNSGDVEAEEIAQLYVRDLVGSVTRPVRELKGFQRIKLTPGQEQQVQFEIDSSDLAFYNRRMQLVTEPGKFQCWIGGSSEAQLETEFEFRG